MRNLTPRPGSPWRALLIPLLAGLALALAAPAASAQTGGSDVGGASAKKLNKGGFSLDQYEQSQFDARAKKIEARMHAIRLKKIKSLQDIVKANVPYKHKADVLFRLAEAYWSESKYQYLLARDEYDKKYDCWEQKRCTEEPKEPVEDYSTAINYYRQVLAQFPTYRRIDEVMYYLGKAALKAGKANKDVQLQKEGVKYLNELVQQHPKSRFVANSYLALAEYFFETDNLFYAKTNYEKIIRNFPHNPMYNYALYKLGWVYFNLTEFEKTIETFKKVVAKVGKGAIEFREQALNDLVVTWAEVDNGWQDARDYFLKEIGEKKTYEKLDKMASLLVSKDRDLEAIALYKHLINHDKVNPKCTEYYDAIMEVRRKIGDMADIETEINEITNFFDHKGAWYIANKGDAERTEAADDLVSTNLFYMANYYHRDAQKLEKERKPARDQYMKAAHYYKAFLDRFPNHKNAYKLRFYYAEILYDQVKDFKTAAAEYEKVVAEDTKGEYVEDAALGVIYSIEELMVQAGLRERATKGSVQVVKTKESKADMKAKAAKPIPRTPLHPLEKRYIAAADKYVEVLSKALKDPAFRKKYPKRGKMIPEIMFIAAQTFYRHGMFRDAVERLMVIFDLYPKHRMANIAVNTIIDAYARLKHWEKIEEWARKLIRERNFLVKTRAELEQMIAIAKTEHARDLTKQRRYDEAIRIQQEIVDEFGRKNKDLASKALYNIGVIHESARRFPQAVAAYEQVIKRYKGQDVAVQAQFDIGVLYENQTKFAEAAAAFIKMKQFKDKAQKDKVADAIRNAALIYEALEQYDEAYKTFQLYVKTYKTNEDTPTVAFHAAEVAAKKGTAEGHTQAAKAFEKVARTFGRKDKQYNLRATAAAGNEYKKADKVKNRKRAVKLFNKALKAWNELATPNKKTGKVVAPAASTKAYAGMASLELAEYVYDDYARLKLKALNNRGKFDVRLLKNTLIAKAEALAKTQQAFEKVLAFKDPGMAAAAAFRMGLIYYEFAESLFNAEVPPGLTEEQTDEYRYQLEEVAAPIQEKALTAFTLALKNALNKGVYNKWSRLSAKYAAKVNPDEFPIADFRLKPDKTKDTIQSTSFIRTIRRGDVVVDFTKAVKMAK